MLFPIPERAAPYLVQTAIELGVLEKDIYKEGFVSRWGARGYVIGAISPDIPSELPSDLRLLERDKLAFLKYYMDADGIALLHFARKLQEQGEIEQAKFLASEETERMWNSIINESLDHIRSDRLRSETRELLRRSRFLAGKPRAKGKFLEHVRKHKFTPHMEALVDLDIVERSPPPSDWRLAKELEMKDGRMKIQVTSMSPQERVVYRPRLQGSTSRVDEFLDCFRDLPILDKILSPSEGSYFTTAAKLYGLRYPRVDLAKDFETLKKEIVRAYEFTRDDVYRLAFLDSIKDIVCINLQVSNAKICEPQDVWAAIEEMRKMSEKDVRYHRDNYGVITYVALSAEYVKSVLSS
jgi:hypothetical protein